MNFSANDFKQTLGCFATGITIATTLYNEKNYGITINSFTSVSLEPPLISFCLGKNSASYQAFSTNKFFAINILADDQQNLSQNFAMREQKNWDKNSHNIVDNKFIILNGIIAYLKCELYNKFDGGDHTILIGKIIQLQKLSDKKPLIYFQSNYHKLEA